MGHQQAGVNLVIGHNQLLPFGRKKNIRHSFLFNSSCDIVKNHLCHAPKIVNVQYFDVECEQKTLILTKLVTENKF